MNRVIPGLILAAAWLLLLTLAPAWLFGLVLVFGAGLALNEYFRMSMPTVRGGVRLGAILCGLAPVLAALSGQAELVLRAGQTVPVSRRYLKSLKEAIGL